MSDLLEPGEARSPGLSYQQLLDQDTHEVPVVLRLESPRFLGNEDIPTSRYTSREWHEIEVEKLWSRVWQYVCREEEIPEVGDYHVYDIARFSYIIIRSAPDEITAFPNACLHRGRRLKDYDGNCSEIRCPFHGHCWEVTGELKNIPAAWDFPHLEERGSDYHLTKIKVETWAGFVFINPDPECETFEDFIGDMADHFKDWDLANRYKQAHVAKVIDCNWKIAQEAFCEAYHVNATHPQMVNTLGDTNSQIDIWDNFARCITSGGTVSPDIDSEVNPEQIMKAMMDIRHDQDLPMEIPDSSTARAVGAAGSRERWREEAGDWVDQLSDAEMMDSIYYTLFPNFHPWGAFNRIVYRFRPNGDNHRSCIMECIFIAPFLDERPPPAPIHWLEEHETFTDATELGMLGKVFNQDLFNMAKVQIGLEASHKPGISLGNYQEAKVRWIHQKLTQWCE